MTSSEGPEQTPPEEGQDFPEEQALPGRPQRQARPRQEPNPALDPRLARLERQSRQLSSRNDMSLLLIGVVAFFFGVAVHFWVASAVLNSGAESSDDPVAATATADLESPTEAPTASAAATNTPLPDRTECDEIRGTQYRSVTEREFFLENCTGEPEAPTQQPDAQPTPAQEQQGQPTQQP